MTSHKLRVMILGPYPEAGRVFGGVEAACSVVAEGLSRHPEVEQVTVVTFNSGKRQRADARLSPTLELRHLYLPFLEGDVLVRSRQIIWALRPLLAELAPDVVHGQGMDRHGDVAVQLGLPACVTVHGMVHYEAHQLAERMRGLKRVREELRALTFDMMVRRVLGQASVVISISDYDARALDDLIGGKRVNIPNAISPEFFVPPSPFPATPTVLFGGVLRPRKNVLGLVRAFARVRDAIPTAKLVVAGPEPEPRYAQQVRDTIASHRLAANVSLVGHLNNPQMVEAIKASTAMALFSHQETLPVILAQAMAVGRPVVATGKCGVPEMISEGQNGFMVDDEDEATLAARLIELLENPALAQTMGDSGRLLARQRYESSAVAEQTVRAYRLAIESARAGQLSRSAQEVML
jgi:glycosyltransferase involved in cell wall biosynthesis